MSQNPGTTLESSAKSLYEVTGNISDLNTLLIGVNELRAKTRSDSGAKGDVVITTNEVGQIVAVTRQDSEGRILSVIAEAAPVPPGYKLVLVPEEVALDEPDWEDVRRQAEVSTGIKVNDHTMSIMIREVRRWIAHKSRISGKALCLPITGQKESASVTPQQHAQPARLPLALASAPERIWLDLGFNPYEQDAHFSTFHDLTWSPDNASGHGIEYVCAKRNICATQPAQSDHLFELWWAEYMPGATQARAWAAWCAAHQQAAPQQEAQEPVMIYHGGCTIDCGEHGHHNVELLRMIPAGSKLYTAPKPSPAPQGNTQIAPADVLLRTAIAETLYQQVRIEHDNRIGPWSAFDVREQQRIVDSIQGLCSVFAPASQGNGLE